MHVQEDNVTQAQSMEEVSTNGRRHDGGDGTLTRTLIWVGVAGLSAALAFTLLRSRMLRRPADPTSRRIQQLIDEANQLLKTLDDKHDPV